MKLHENFPLKEITTMHLDARCRYLAEYSSIDELRTLLASPFFKEQKSMHIGGGSNLVFTVDYDGLLLHSQIKFIATVEETEPALKGQTVSNSGGKPAILDNGVRVQVPLFIEQGEKIVVNTETLEYVERAK